MSLLSWLLYPHQLSSIVEEILALATQTALDHGRAEATVSDVAFALLSSRTEASKLLQRFNIDPVAVEKTLLENPASEPSTALLRTTQKQMRKLDEIYTTINQLLLALLQHKGNAFTDALDAAGATDKVRQEMLHWYRKPRRAPRLKLGIRLNNPAQITIALAEDIAAKNQHKKVTISDLTFALLDHPPNGGCEILRRFQIHRTALETAALTTPGAEPYTVLLPVAQAKAGKSFSRLLAVEHLLLAMLRHNNNPFTTAMTNRQIPPAAIEEAALKHMEPDFPN